MNSKNKALEPINLYKIMASWRWRISWCDLTEQAFAEKAGISRTALSLYLNGERNPTLDNFHKIENFLRKAGV